MNWTDPGYATVAELVGERTGLDSPPQRRDSIELGIRRAMARAGTSQLDGYISLIKNESKAFDDLIVELVVGETYFFREPQQFLFIRREILPGLRNRHGAEHVIRAWSAGCASGEEAYSLAILFEEEGLGEQCYLLATDISRQALAKAHRSLYSNWSLRGEGAALAAPYLLRRNDGSALLERIRRRVLFQHLNLALDVYPSFATGTWGMDLILCRNVLIYFPPETVQLVARRLLEALAPGGWLITASSDPPLIEGTGFETIVTDAGLFYRRPGGSQGPEVGGQRSEVGGQKSEVGSQWSEEVHDLQATHDFKRTPEPDTGQGQLTTDERARRALAVGDYELVLELTRDLQSELAFALRVRALANRDAGEADRACAEAVARYPLSTELHYLHAVLLVELGREEEAIGALRRVIYLDRTLAVAHFTLGSLLARRSDMDGARRAYRNTRGLCLSRPAEEVVPLSEGEHAGRLAEAAAMQIAILEEYAEPTP